MGKSYNYQPAGELTVSTTGNITDLDLTGCGLVRMTNASLTTIQGIKEGYEGQLVEIISDGAGEVDLAHQSGSEATVTRKLTNFCTSGVTPLAPGVGCAALRYSKDKGGWRLVRHEQGAPITRAYNSANYVVASGSWSVAAGTVREEVFFLRGRMLQLIWAYVGTTISADVDRLKVLIPNGYAPSTAYVDFAPLTAFENATGYMSNCIVDVWTGDPTYIRFWRPDYGSTLWDHTSAVIHLFGSISFGVT